MTTRLDDPDVLAVLAAMRPEATGPTQDWHAGRRQAVLQRVLLDAEPRRTGSSTRARWIGAGLAVAAASAAALLLLPGVLGSPRIEAVTVPATRPPVTEPTWVRTSDGPLSPRYEARGAWVDGRYLLVSGHTDACGPVESGCTADPVLLTDGAFYDPATDGWTPIAPVPLVENLSESVVLDGSVYFLTGSYLPGATEPSISEDFLPGKEQTLLRYQVRDDKWSSYPLPKPAGGHLVATDSAVILFSGSDQGAPIGDLVFHPDTAGWSDLSDDPLGPSSVRYAVWAAGKLLLSAEPLDAADDSTAAPLGLAVLDSDLSGWTQLDPDEPAYGWDPIAVGDHVIWKPGDGRFEIVDDRRTYEWYSNLNLRTGEVTTIRAPYTGYDGYPAGSIAGVWVATADQVVVEGDLVDPATLVWTALPPLENPEGATLTTEVAGENSILLWGGEVPGTTVGHLLLLPPS